MYIILSVKNVAVLKSARSVVQVNCNGPWEEGRKQRHFGILRRKPLLKPCEKGAKRKVPLCSLFPSLLLNLNFSSPFSSWRFFNYGSNIQTLEIYVEPFCYEEEEQFNSRRKNKNSEMGCIRVQNSIVLLFASHVANLDFSIINI